MMYSYPEYGNTPVKIIERGWAGHFGMSHHCQFRRNTLLEFGDKRWVVSTAGNFRQPPEFEIEMIGYNRFYETAAFVAQYINGYWDADFTQELYLESANWQTNQGQDADHEANRMHTNNVIELAKKIQFDIIPLMED